MRTTTKKLENAVTQIKVTFDKKEWAEAQDAALIIATGALPGLKPSNLTLVANLFKAAS